MVRDREYDEVLRRKISEIPDEPLDESVDADDLMFDLGMRYLRMAYGVRSVIDTGIVPEGFEVEIGHCIAGAFAGMSVRDFIRYVRDFAERPSPGYGGLFRLLR